MKFEFIKEEIRLYFSIILPWVMWLYYYMIYVKKQAQVSLVFVISPTIYLICNI